MVDNSYTHFVPPNALCQDVCSYLTTDLCEEEWNRAVEFLTGLEDFLTRFQILFVNCSNPGAPLGSLPHCCSNAGIVVQSGEMIDPIVRSLVKLCDFATVPTSYEGNVACMMFCLF